MRLPMPMQDLARFHGLPKEPAMPVILLNLRQALLAAALIGSAIMSPADTALLEITLPTDAPNRTAAAAVYAKFKGPFLQTVPGAQSKLLLIRDEDVQVLHGFASVADAQAYLKSDLFNHDVVDALTPLLAVAPEVRVYDCPDAPATHLVRQFRRTRCRTAAIDFVHVPSP